MSLKKFEILEMVAKGGMAEVYRAKTVGLQGFEKEVCVKKILPHLTEDESFVTMFINEAKLAATLSYANIVSVHDLCVSAGGEYFIVMEYVHGKDLSDVIRAAQLAGREVPPEMAVYICREVCKGLHYAHSKTDMSGAPLALIHRDISPHNVLVSFMGEIKITDFGIAKAATIMNKTAVGILKGKYGYMSPEQARGQPLDHRSDIFNTGIVLYELLVGERCFAGSSDFSTLNLMRNATVTPPTKINTNVPKELEAIVLKSLSADRGDRYKDALDMEAALGRFAESRGRRVSAPDLAQFMRELFSSTEQTRANNSTGVLSLNSVAGPVPASPKDRAENKPAEKSEKVEKAEKAEKPAPAPQPKTAALPETPAPAPAAATPAKERKPAKIKKDPEPAKEAEKAEAAPEKPAEKAEGKKKGKQQLDAPKKPVGRKDLKPSLTIIQRMARPERRRSLLKAAAVIVVAAAVGTAWGFYRARSISRERTFREMELVTRDPSAIKKPTVTLLISSDPPGASVMLDKIELSDKTPIAVERDRDAVEHDLELTLEGYKPLKKKLKYDDGPVTRFEQRLSGEPGMLKVTTKPSDLPVRVDGNIVGNAPLSLEIASGKHDLEIGDATREIAKMTIEVKPGKTVKIDRKIPPKGSMGTLRIISEPQAQIFLDDQPTGQWTNDGTLTLEPDILHRVTLSVSEKQPRHELMVKLKKGEKKELFVDLTGSS
jgi:serine/threonine protein kinase